MQTKLGTQEHSVLKSLDGTRIPEMLGRFLNFNKMKTKIISKSHEPIFYSH